MATILTPSQFREAGFRGPRRRRKLSRAERIIRWHKQRYGVVLNAPLPHRDYSLPQRILRQANSVADLFDGGQYGNG